MWRQSHWTSIHYCKGVIWNLIPVRDCLSVALDCSLIGLLSRCSYMYLFYWKKHIHMSTGIPWRHVHVYNVLVFLIILHNFDFVCTKTLRLCALSRNNVWIVHVISIRVLKYKDIVWFPMIQLTNHRKLFMNKKQYTCVWALGILLP